MEGQSFLLFQVNTILLQVAFTTVCTFLVMWTPLAFYGDENSAFDAIKRIFPFERGLFEVTYFFPSIF